LARILYVITDLQVGGVPLHLRRLAAETKARGHDVAVVSLAPVGPVGEMIRSDGIEVDSCDGRGGWDARVIFRLAKIIKKRKPDLLHALLFHANVASRWAARWAGLPKRRVICEIQTVEVERTWHLKVDRWTHRGCRFTIGNSPSVVEHLATRAGIPRDRLRLVRGGVEDRRLRTTVPIDRAELGLSESDKMLLWVGRLDPVKGLDVLLGAMQGVYGGVGTHLFLAGDGPLRETLTARIASLGLTHRVHLLGRRDDVAALLKAADVFVFPSRTEGLPNALLEAMAAGCAIVTTDVPGCRDLIVEEGSGLLVPYGDVEALRHAIDRLLTDEIKAKRLARRAQLDVINDFSIAKMFQAYEQAYQEALGVPPAR